MKYLRTAGLSSSEVTEEAERMLSVAKERLLGGEGPGLSSTSPERSREK